MSPNLYDGIRDLGKFYPWNVRVVRRISIATMSLFPSTPATSPRGDHHSRKVSFGRARRPLIFLFTVTCLTSVAGYRFYNQPKLNAGKISPVTIVAPIGATFEDRDTTDKNREKIRAGVIPVLRRDEPTTAEIERSLSETLDFLDRLRKTLRKTPLPDVSALSPSTRQFLLTGSESAWSSLQASFSSKESPLYPLTEVPEYVLRDLQNYQQRIGATRLQKVLDRWGQIRREAADVPLGELSYTAVSEAARESDRDWERTKQELPRIARAILVQGIPPGMSKNHLRETIAFHVSDRLPPAGRSLGLEILPQVLAGKVNLIEDTEATRQQATRALEAVETVTTSIQEGQIIVRAGQKIERADFVVLDGLGLSERGINWTGLGVTGILVTGAIGTFCLIARRLHRPLRHRDFILLSLFSLSTPILAIAHVPFTNLAAIGLLTGSFYGPTLAVTQVLLTSGLSAFSLNALTWDLLAGTAGGILASLVAGKLRSRDEFSLLGVGVGLTQGTVYLLSYLIVSATAGTIVYTILPHAIVYGLSGLAWTVIALGISPFLERFFDVVTPIRLVELSNPNGDLLKRLATEAPGTFQHTLFVACLAEAAARELHCNVELIRAGTLYHDIGKMHDPLGFIENQMGGPNKHDAIDDPYTSAKIIKKHVTEGIVMAKKYGLPRAIRDFIPEHQGTLLISYFYHQAKQRSDKNGKEVVPEECFRYDGPIPRSRETGIVMLADSSEAALRSMKDVTAEQAMEAIKKIFQARWRENQLVESGLRLEELPIIAEVFVRVWQQFHHQRIAYPKAALEARTTERKAV
jgi:cyclic-di-AMP phosphodiesterase PgpH